jgi:rare lipoprotein A
VKKYAPSIIVCLSLLSACSSSPTRSSAPAPASTAAAKPAAVPAGGGYLAGDGPGADAPANLDSLPDAIPKAEPLHRYANRPYSALGKTYTPLAAPGSYKERGTASWYGKKFHGQRTSIGDTYDMYGMTAAHPTLPVPSYARVTNLANGKSVVVRVNDRGPFLHNRIIDLSYAAAYKLGYVNQGSAEVEVESLVVDGNAPVATAITPVKVETGAATTVIPVMSSGTAGKVFLQLGAFRERQGAESFLAKMRAELGDSGKDIVLLQKGGLTRIHIGPYANADEARRTADILAARLGFKPFVSQH